MADLPAGHGHRFTPENKLRTAKDFDRVFKEGRKKVRPSLIVFYCPSLGGVSRIGMAVSRKVGNAVSRNIVRRRLRETMRVHKALFTGPYDIVIVGRPGAAELPSEALRTDFLSALRAAGILPRLEASPTNDQS